MAPLQIQKSINSKNKIEINTPIFCLFNETTLNDYFVGFIKETVLTYVLLDLSTLSAVLVLDYVCWSSVDL